MTEEELFSITGYRKIPIICGPTASGKTALSIRTALDLGGEICCCDSMQIYKHLTVGTAKPTEEEKSQVPHHLIDLVEPQQPFNVASYLECAYTVIEEILSRGRLPVFCGGTGQYVSALFKGISFDDAPVDADLEKKIFEEAGQNGIDAIYRRLTEIDPEGATKIHPNNTKRVVHTLALCLSLGKTTAEIHQDSLRSGARYPFALFCIDWPRDVLYERINKRVDLMMQQGILEEARWLYDQHFEPNITAMQAIGYKEFFPFFENRCSLEDSVEKLKQHTRNYAKRQLTWFRHMEEIHWIPSEDLTNYSPKLYL